MTGTTMPRGDDEFWPDEHDSLPAPWWRMSDDIRLQVRIRSSELPNLLFTSDLSGSLNVHGPLYVNLAHLTVWDTYLLGERPTRTAYKRRGRRSTPRHAHRAGCGPDQPVPAAHALTTNSGPPPAGVQRPLPGLPAHGPAGPGT